MVDDKPGCATQSECRWLTGPPAATLTRFGEVPHYREGLYELTADTYAWMVPNGSWGETNLGLVCSGRESLLIDTGWDLRVGQQFLAACADVLAKAPVEFVVNTHADGDHCWGNQLLSGRPIIATAACAAQFDHFSPKSLLALKHGSRVMRRLPKHPLRLFNQYMAAMFAPYDFADVSLTPPTDVFSGEKQLTVGGLDVVLLEVGPGHSAGDAFVLIPERGVVYAGDMVFVGVTPVMWAGPVSNIERALRRLLAMPVRCIVPGHGPLATRADLQALLDYWEFVQLALRPLSEQGMHSTEAARSVLLSAEFQAQPFARWDSPERLVTSAWNLYREWGLEQVAPPGPLGPLNLMRMQAGVAQQLPGATPGVMHQLHSP